MSKTVTFSNTFRYINDSFSVNNENFRTFISEIYPSELELKDTMTLTEVCYLGTKISREDSNAPAHVSAYDKKDDFAF